MRLNAHIPPDSPAVTVFHRGLMAAGAMRLAGRDEPGARAVARALRSTAAGRMPAAERELVARVERRRAELPAAMVAAGESHGPASEPGPERPEEGWPLPRWTLEEARQTCRWTSLAPVWGRLLTRLVAELAPRSCLELGTGLGLSAAYQAAALEVNGSGRLVTLDMHEAARIAERGFGALGLESRVRLEFGLIDETLPAVLEQVGPVDYALLDADHSEAATVRHFDAVIPHLSDGAVALFDDITQTDEMKRAWRAIANHERVAVALGLRRLGVVVLSGRG